MCLSNTEWLVVCRRVQYQYSAALHSYRAISRITQHTPPAWDAGKGRELPVWTGAGQAYSDGLRFDAALRQHVYGSLIDAVAAWFDALEKAPPLIAPR